MLTLPLDSPSTTLSTAGGKGHNLSILSRSTARNNDDVDCNQEEILIPPGFVVTIDAYHDFMNQDDKRILREVENALNKYEKSDEDERDLEETSASIRGAFRKRSLSKTLQDEIANQLSNIQSTTSSHQKQQECNFAVRSSATCEDLPDASFAGQHDTYLNVPPSQITGRVIDCFSSLFTTRAISYRNRNGISHVDAGMAVVVQCMAPSQSTSGVLFTANPLTGRRDECVLESIPGLGEALVSGLTEPDRYIVSVTRDVKDDGDDAQYDATTAPAAAMEIKDARIGTKSKVITSIEGGGIKEEEKLIHSTSSTAAPILSDEDVKRIIQVGKRIECMFNGTPQDIEWAMSTDGRIYIVQSRPITTLFPLPDFTTSGSRQVYFSFNAGECVWVLK